MTTLTFLLMALSQEPAREELLLFKIPVDKLPDTTETPDKKPEKMKEKGNGAWID